MQSPGPAYQLSLAAAVVISAGLAASALRDRDHRGSLGLAVLFVGAAIWSLATLLAALSPPAIDPALLLRFSLVGFVMVPYGTVLLVLTFAGYETHLTRRALAALAVEPIVFVALAVTNDAHRLVWVELGPTPVQGAVAEYGPAFFVHAAYSYLLLLGGTAVAVAFALRSTPLHRRQAWGIVAATLVPLGANVANLLGTTGVDLTPVAFTVTGVVLAWAIRRAGLLDVSPLARRSVLDNVEESVFVVDASGRLLDVNERGRALLDDADPVGTSVEAILDGRDEFLSFYRAVRNASDSVSRDVVDGERHYRIRATPLFDAREDLVAHVFLARDVTEQRRREARLERRNEQLRRFASVVSHDLRNPLNVAASSLELARETGEDQHFDRAADALDRTETLIDDMLSLARTDDDEMEVAAVSLAAVARESWEFVDTLDADLEVLDDERIVANRDRLLQLFENLYRNAVEHGGRDVTVTVGTLPEGFFVADDGAGFRDVDPDSLFDAHYSTDAGGTGLGLFIVAEIAGSHGWTVEAMETSGGGARFEFRRDPTTPLVRESP